MPCGRQILTTFIFCSILQTAYMQEKASINDLQKRVEAKLDIPNAHFGIAFKDLANGETLLDKRKGKFSCRQYNENACVDRII